MKLLMEQWRKYISEEYEAKGKCVYKKGTTEKVGCTDGPVNKYLAALNANVDDVQSEDQSGAIKEGPQQTYYWQTTGAWSGADRIRPGNTHVPKTNPRSQGDGKVEKIFEEVRREQFPDRPSRLSCVYLCKNLDGHSGGSFCRYPAPGNGETYEVRLKGEYNLFEADADYWTEAVMSFERGDEQRVRTLAEEYWEGDDTYMGSGEILVSPPESAIIDRKI